MLQGPAEEGTSMQNLTVAGHCLGLTLAGCWMLTRPFLQSPAPEHRVEMKGTPTSAAVWGPGRLHCAHLLQQGSLGAARESLHQRLGNLSPPSSLTSMSAGLFNSCPVFLSCIPVGYSAVVYMTIYASSGSHVPPVYLLVMTEKVWNTMFSAVFPNYFWLCWAFRTNQLHCGNSCPYNPSSLLNLINLRVKWTLIGWIIVSAKKTIQKCYYARPENLVIFVA